MTTEKKSRDNRTICPTCKKRYRRQYDSQKYCTPSCQSGTAKRASTRARRPYTIPLDAYQRYQILEHVRSAGTVQILTSWVGDVDEAVATIKVLTSASTANLKTGKGNFHVCHVDPVKHSHRLGLLSSKNLFVGLGTRNRAQKAFSSGMGQWISRLELRAKWDVDDRMTNDDTWRLIEEFVGLTTLTEACRKAGLKPSAKAQALANLTLLIDPDNREHDQYAQVLKNPKSTTVDLQMAVAAIQGKRFFSLKLRATNEQEILFSEIRRHADHRPDLAFLLAPIAKMYSTITEEDDERFSLFVGVLNDDHLQTLFNLLQGHNRSDMVDEVDELLFGFNFASRQITNRSDEYLAFVERERLAAIEQAASEAYWALPRAERLKVDAERQELVDIDAGLIYQEDGTWWRQSGPVSIDSFARPPF